jgi:hypothetical protein
MFNTGTRRHRERARRRARPVGLPLYRAVPHAEAGFGPPDRAVDPLRRTASLPHSPGATRRACHGQAAPTAPPDLWRHRRIVATSCPYCDPLAVARKETPSPPPCSPLNAGRPTPARTAPQLGCCRRAMANPHGELHLSVLVVANQSCYYLP